MPRTTPSIRRRFPGALGSWVNQGRILVLLLAAILDLPARGDDTPSAPADGWAFRPLRQASPPTSDSPARHPVDRFVRAEWKRAGLRAAPLAGRRTLVRRVYFDVLGLPPTPEQVERFVRDEAPDAWERLIDRLLASPHYGERRARQWLDLARYAETNGYERDATKPHAWRYRDYVVRAFNQDRPFDRFLTEQLAGDELPDRSEETVIATGFLRLGTWNDEPNDPFEYKFVRLEDLVHTTTTAFLSLTVKCARCHDHKFDPIPQADYYRIAAAFWAGFVEPRDRSLMGGPSADELGFDVLGWTDRGRDVPPLHRLEKGDPHKPKEVVPPGFLSLLPELDRPVPPPPAQSTTTRRRLELARWMTDPHNPLTPRVAVNRIWQSLFGEGLVRTPNNFGARGAPPTHPELLDWLARELVRGGWRLKPLYRLLLTSETYRQSSRPPDTAGAAAIDPRNRLWWRASRRRLDAESLRDALLATSGELRRQIGGPSFYPRMPADALEGLSRKGATWGKSTGAERRRRSLYIFSKRSLILPFLTTFDFSDTTLPCGKRPVSTVPTQALTLLNNGFVHEMSRALARRVTTVAGEGAAAGELVRQAWRFTLLREPDAAELDAAVDHMEQQRELLDGSRSDAIAGDVDLALVSLCHVLLNTNEFVYID